MEKFNSKLILNEIEKMHFDMCCKNAKFAVISLDHNLLHLALMTHFEENNIFFKINLDTFLSFYLIIKSGQSYNDSIKIIN